MRFKPVILIACTGVLVLVTAVAFAWDSSRSNGVANGVRVADTDVSGLNRGEVESKLRRRLQRPLQEDIVVKVGTKSFKLNPTRDTELELDIGGMADEAVARSREGWFISRSWRDIKGSDINAHIPMKLTYDKAKLRRWAHSVEGKVELSPKDASISYSGSSVSTVPARDGLAVSTASMKRQIERRLKHPNKGRAVTVRVKVTKPDVTEGRLPAEYPVIITVDRGSKQLRLWKRLKLAKTYTIAVGAIGYETPAGLYNVQDKQVDPIWRPPASKWVSKKLQGKAIPPGPDNPLKARWLGIYNGAGIHGTEDIASLGTAASHGCIRMSVSDVMELYDQVPVGAPVYIG